MKCDELAPRATAITDSIGSRLVQDAGRLSAAPKEASLKELSAKRAQLEKRQEVMNQEETGFVHGDLGGSFTSKVYGHGGACSARH